MSPTYSIGAERVSQAIIPSQDICVRTSRSRHARSLCAFCRPCRNSRQCIGRRETGAIPMTARISTAMGTHWGSVVRAIDFIYTLTAFGALGGLPMLLDLVAKYARSAMTRFWSLRRRRNQSDSGDFRWNAQAVGRSPVAGAAAHVNPKIPQTMQSGGERLEVAYEKIPGPELTAMRVPGDLNVEAGAGRGIRRTRLVRQAVSWHPHYPEHPKAPRRGRFVVPDRNDARRCR